MNYVVTRSLTPVEGVTIAVKTDLEVRHSSVAPNLNFKLKF